jgi:cell division inhibitor SepF
MGVLDMFLDAIKLNDDYDENDSLDDGVLDDEDDDEGDFLDDDDDVVAEKPKKKFFEKFGNKKKTTRERETAETDDDLDFDLDEEEEVKEKTTSRVSASAAKTTKTTFTAPKTTAEKAPVKQQSERTVRPSSKITPMRSSKRTSAPNMEVCVIKPSSMEDTREIADTLLDGSTIILNLEGLEVELAQRIIDFTSGSCYSLGGSLQKITGYVFVLGPYNVDITGDMQNILLGGTIPSVKAGY